MAIRGHVDSIARKFTAISRRARAATSGNKNVTTRAKRQGKQTIPGTVGGMTGTPIAGPDLGDG